MLRLILILLIFILLTGFQHFYPVKLNLGYTPDTKVHTRIDTLHKIEIIPDLKAIFLNDTLLNPKVRFIDTSLNLSDREVNAAYQETINSNKILLENGEISEDLNNKIRLVNQGFQEYLWYKRLLNTKEKTGAKDRTCIKILIRDGLSNTIQSDLLRQLLDTYPDQWKQSEEWKNLKTRLQQKSIIGTSILAYPRVDLITTKRTTIPLEKIIKSDKKYTVLAFTASWCQPCHNNYNIFKGNFDQLENKNTLLISYSLDKSYENWLRLANKENYIQACYNDSHSFDSKFIKALGISSIPSYILSDNNGIILGKYNASQLPELFRLIDKQYSNSPNQ